MSDAALLNHAIREKLTTVAHTMNQPVKAFTKVVQPNPKLEDLRKEGIKDPHNEYNINNLLEKTKILHAGFLFHLRYRKLLQKLLRLLDGNFDTYHMPGWASFGHHLGLSMEILKVIECSKLGNEGYTYYVLQHYIQKDDATIQKVVQALVDMKRKDVIHQTYSYFDSLANEILEEHRGNRQESTSVNQQSGEECGTTFSATSNLANDVLEEYQGNQQECISNQQSDEESGIFSVISIAEVTDEGRDQVNDQMPQNMETLIRPNFIPTPALLLQELKEHVYRATIVPTAPQLPKIEHQYLQNAEPTSIPRNVRVVHHTDSETRPQIIPKYDCKVMLTFAADGIDYATQVTQILRAKQKDGQIGVLILDEHERSVSCNPELFISGTFPQVDYVIPIITEGYLKAIMDTRPPFNIESRYIDCKYVRFIYTLMLKYYVRNGCLNKKIRCIIPDDLTHLVNKTRMREPIFETWFPSSKTNTLAERMLWRCRRKTNSHQQNIES